MISASLRGLLINKLINKIFDTLIYVQIKNNMMHPTSLGQSNCLYLRFRFVFFYLSIVNAC